MSSDSSQAGSNGQGRDECQVFSFPLDKVRQHSLMTAELAAQLPGIKDQESKLLDATVFLRLFSTHSRLTLYVVEFDGDDTLFGYMISPLGPDCDEWGYSSLRELAEMQVKIGESGLPIVERDLYFTQKTLRECLKDDRHEAPRYFHENEPASE